MDGLQVELLTFQLGLGVISILYNSLFLSSNLIGQEAFHGW